jgi:phenylacetic acid degradation operon negative regulatory protein
MVVVGNASTSIPGGNPIRAWDLDEMRSRYEEFIAAFSPVAADVRAGGLTGGDALLVRTAVIDAWRSFPGVDPELPAELLPPDWPQQRARALFVEIYDALGPPATARVRELLRAHDPERAQYAMHHTSLDALELAAS